MKRGMREGGFGTGELHARLVCRAGRGGEGARCPVLVRVCGGSSSTSGMGDGGGSGREIVFGRLEGEGGEEMGLVACLGAAREILQVLEESFQGRDGEGKEEESGRQRTRSCEVEKSESVTCCVVKDCEVASERVVASGRVSCEVSESGVIRLDSRESGENEICC